MHGARIDNRGVIALVTVIVIGALLLMVGLATAQLGQTQLIVVGQADQGQWARHYAVACVEEAVFRLRRNPTFAGTTVPIDGYTCDVTVSGVGVYRDVVSTATVGDYTKSLTVQLYFQNVTGGGSTWTIESWEETDPQS
jgi:hypothetical protein